MIYYSILTHLALLLTDSSSATAWLGILWTSMKQQNSKESKYEATEITVALHIHY